MYIMINIIRFITKALIGIFSIVFLFLIGYGISPRATKKFLILLSLFIITISIWLGLDNGNKIIEVFLGIFVIFILIYSFLIPGTRREEDKSENNKEE